MAHLTIIRGLPGSGKSTFAAKIASPLLAVVLEADQFFSRETGLYKYDKSKIKDAHKWCQDQTFGYLRDGYNVIVANTFTQRWEMQPYIDYCVEVGHAFTVITCEGNYGNVHGVPEEAVERMRKRWEPYVS